MDSKNAKRLKHIFFGKLPETFSLDHMDALPKALERQGISIDRRMELRDLQKVNYSTLIQDIFEVIREGSTKEEENAAKTDKELAMQIEVGKINNSTLMKAAP